ncbi:hypothetical protein [uncultured Polaribacter sp.]|uniref:hypothetical protein n=1 Tax=uncultured Polaribacter sp. TaxID=174711 RepID=UPI00259B2353|nr:hypothetical protein [uncultured Polaribacter sp.]
MPKKKQKFAQVTDKHKKAMQWCINNNIKVGVKPTKKGLKVEINNNGSVKVSPNIYNNVDACNKVWELYLYLYNNYWEV